MGAGGGGAGAGGMGGSIVVVNWWNAFTPWSGSEGEVPLLEGEESCFLGSGCLLFFLTCLSFTLLLLPPCTRDQ